MRLEAAVWGSLLTTTACCSAIKGLDVVNHLNRRLDNADEHMRRQASRTVNQLARRNDVFGASGGLWPTVAIPAGYTLAAGVQLTTLPGLAFGIETNTAVSGGPTATPAPSTNAPISDPAKWNAEAEQKCQDAVTKLEGKANNPSGLAVCYNVPFLDQQRGVFEAELRIYNISAPTDPFVAITPSMMMVTLQYQGATISRSDGRLPVKRSLEERQALVERQANGIMMPTGVAIRKYVGQVNRALMTPGMNL